MKTYIAILLVIALGLGIAHAQNLRPSYTRNLVYWQHRIQLKEWPEAGALVRRDINVIPMKGPFAGRMYKQSFDHQAPAERLWVGDFERTGRFQIVVATKPASSNPSGFTIYQWTGRGLKTVKVPAVNEAVMIGYRGHDRFNAANQSIIREFPAYQAGDPDALPTGGVRIIRYIYQNGQWIPRISTKKSDEFLATGTEPFWMVNILHGKVVRFFNAGREKAYYFPYKSPRIRRSVWTYVLANSKGDKMTVVITRAKCINDMSGRESNYKAEAIINGEKFSGCAERPGR